METLFLLLIISVAGIANARLLFMELNVSSGAAHLSRQLDNHHIVFVGDSLLRYQYISLVYMIQYGEFFPATASPNILVQKTFPGWFNFYNTTNALFAPHEHCDCYREDGSYLTRDIYENRYYHNKERNISISYIQYFGDDVETHGHWLPTDSPEPPFNQPPTRDPVPFAWQFPTINTTLTDLVFKLQPKPSVLLMNAGHWPNKWAEKSHRDNILNLALSYFDRVIWKTTNYRIEGTQGDHAHEEACEYPGVECMNLDWTKYLAPTDYVDMVHFTPDIYTDVNIQFIHQLLRKKAANFVPLEAQYIGQVMNTHGKHFLVDKKGILRPFDGHLCNDTTPRKHLHLSVGMAIKYIMGEAVLDSCTFEG